MGEAPTRYLSTRQAAAILGLSPRTLESYRVKGGGPPFFSCCNRIRYLRADLDAWALQGRRVSTSDDGGEGDAKRQGNSRSGRARRVGAGRKGAAMPGRTTADAKARKGAPGVAAAIGTGPAHLGVDELARLLGISRRTLDRYRARGDGPAFEKVDGRVRYARADVEAWLASIRLDPGADGWAGL